MLFRYLLCHVLIHSTEMCIILAHPILFFLPIQSGTYIILFLYFHSAHTSDRVVLKVDTVVDLLKLYIFDSGRYTHSLPLSDL